jgi:HAD superfamily hydrolase (TIGR01509 family)
MPRASPSEPLGVRAVLFDLFDTLVRFDRERLPAVEIGGRVVRTTAGRLHPLLREWAPAVTLEALYQALLDSWAEAERRRGLDHREVAAPERFAHLLRCIRLDPGACPPDLLQALLETHRRELAKAAEFPPHHAALLADLAGRYRLGVVSNFDYSPTALGILEDAGVAHLFDAVVVSDAVGWRKPAPVIFAEALRRLEVAPAEALFVGDRADIDIAGAHAVGLRTAWLNPQGEGRPAGVPAPDVEIQDLEQLRPILGLGPRIAGPSPGI